MRKVCISGHPKGEEDVHEPQTRSGSKPDGCMRIRYIRPIWGVRPEVALDGLLRLDSMYQLRTASAAEGASVPTSLSLTRSAANSLFAALRTWLGTSNLPSALS